MQSDSVSAALVENSGCIDISYTNGVEEQIVLEGEPGCRQAGGESDGLLVNLRCDGTQPARPVIDRIHTSHHGEQNLSGANV